MKLLVVLGAVMACTFAMPSIGYSSLGYDGGLVAAPGLLSPALAAPGVIAPGLAARSIASPAVVAAHGYSTPLAYAAAPAVYSAAPAVFSAAPAVYSAGPLAISAYAAPIAAPVAAPAAATEEAAPAAAAKSAEASDDEAVSVEAAPSSDAALAPEVPAAPEAPEAPEAPAAPATDVAPVAPVPSPVIASAPVLASAPVYASAPLAAPIFAAPAAVAVAAPVTKTQYHSQDELGNAAFGHSEPGQVHNAVQDAHGNRVGSFSYLNPTDGQVHRTDYVADGLGYRVAANDLPLGPAAPVAETPEVAAARAAHIAAHSRGRRSLLTTPASTAPLATPLVYAAPAVLPAPITYAAPVAAPVVAHSYAAPVLAHSYAAPLGLPATLTTIVNNPGHAVSYRID